MNKSKAKFYEGRTARIVINIVLASIVAVTSGLITKFESPLVTAGMIVLCIAGIVVQVIYAAALSTVDKKREIAIEEAVRQLESYQVLFDDLSTNLQDCSVGINKIARTIISKGEAQEDRWTFNDGSNVICEVIRKFVIKQCVVGDSVAINYVKRHDDNDQIIELVGCSNTIHEPPDLYRIKRNINGNGKYYDVYYDAKMFKLNSSHRVIRLNTTEVDKILEYKDRDRDAGKKEQIAFIPVMCEKKKMVGLLEIIANKGTRIAETEEDMDKVVMKVRILYTTLLLLQKSEKAALAVPKKTTDETKALDESVSPNANESSEERLKERDGLKEDGNLIETEEIKTGTSPERKAVEASEVNTTSEVANG